MGDRMAVAQLFPYRDSTNRLMFRGQIDHGASGKVSKFFPVRVADRMLLRGKNSQNKIIWGYPYRSSSGLLAGRTIARTPYVITGGATTCSTCTVSGLKVELYSGVDLLETTVTRNTGGYTLYAPDAGTYTVTIYAPSGCMGANRGVNECSFSVSQSETVTVTGAGTFSGPSISLLPDTLSHTYIVRIGGVMGGEPAELMNGDWTVDDRDTYGLTPDCLCHWTLETWIPWDGGADPHLQIDLYWDSGQWHIQVNTEVMCDGDWDGPTSPGSPIGTYAGSWVNCEGTLTVEVLSAS